MLVVLVACAGTSFDGHAMYRSGQMHALRDKLKGRDPSDAKQAILFARNEIDLRVVWDDGSLAAAYAAITAAKTTDPKLAAEVVQAEGEVMFWQKLVEQKGGWPALATQFERAIAMREAAGDRRGVVESMFYRGLIAQFIETPEAAKGYWERARELGKDVKDPLVRSYPIRHLGDAAEAAGDLALADRLHRESLALREADGDVIRLFNARLTLATFLCERMRACDEAAPQIAAARRTADALRMPHGDVDVGMLEAALAEWRGDLAARDAVWTKLLARRPDDAGPRFARGVARLRAGDAAGAIGDAQGVASRDGHALLAEAAVRSGDLARAETALQAAWTDPASPTARMQLALAAWLGAGRTWPGFDDARAVLDGALAAARRDHDVRAELDALIAVGDHEAARKRAREAHLPLPR